MKDQIEKQAIEEMAKLMCRYCGTHKCSECEGHRFCVVEEDAKDLYNAGYRKKSDVIEEFAKRLKEKMNDLSRMEYDRTPYFLVSKSFVDKIAEEMKGGAE